MNISSFYVVLNEKTEGWSNVKPYKVVAVDVLHVPNIVELDDGSREEEGAMSEFLMDEEDYEEIERQNEERVKEQQGVSKVVTWLMLGNPDTGELSWFDASSVRYVNLKRYKSELQKRRSKT